MRLQGSDPDVQTLVSRIKNGDLKLQPEFQRGEVWSDAKKRRLIDSILRDWHVPPIHVVEVRETARDEVLDGQQRLTAIRDFANDLLKVDGRTEPYDPIIAGLDGLRYSELPSEFRRRFDKFTIRVFRITDYLPGEPYELFFRLNQPTNLTPAEQRNAFFGPAREQVKELVNLLEASADIERVLAFSNSRMAYDDVVARLCLTLEKGSLGEKITSSEITATYRSRDGFAQRTVTRAGETISRFSNVTNLAVDNLRLTRATLYSWFCYFAEISPPRELRISPQKLARFMTEFERLRVDGDRLRATDNALIYMFNDRASSRVSDVSSVIMRDIVIWIFFLRFASEHSIQLPDAHERVNNARQLLARLESQRTQSMTYRVLDETVARGEWVTSV